MNARTLILFGGIILLIAALAAICAPLLTPYDPEALNLAERLVGPSWQHPMGTDQLGRDVFARMLFGARISILVGVLSILIATIIGVTFGAIAGYCGGWIDTLMMRIVDILLCFPSIFLILASIAFIGPNVKNIILILGLTGWMGLSRLIRAEVLSLKEREFVAAARLYGASHIRILLKHILPNAMAPILVNATLGVGLAILSESALSFLGIGIQPPTPSWGNILAEGKATLGLAWWLNLAPGLSIFLVVLGCNLFGEGLRQHWDPKLQTQRDAA